jgi:peptidoglycan/xylan/chitin deacetylase (PgdA/CDA1 family)
MSTKGPYKVATADAPFRGASSVQELSAEPVAAGSAMTIRRLRRALAKMNTPLARRAVFAALRVSLLPLLHREILQRRRVTIVVYHAPTPEVFDTHLEILKRRYNIVALSDYVAAREKPAAGTLPPKALIVTLDDGHRSNHALKAVIEKHGVPVTIFVCSGLVGTRRRFWFLHPAIAAVVQGLKTVSDAERLRILSGTGFNETEEFNEQQALSDAEMHDLRACVDFQSHTVLHPILPRCGTARAEAEIMGSKQDLETRLAVDIYALAYPNGSYSERDVDLAEKAGYRCALTLDSGLNSGTTPRFRLRRIAVPDEAGVHELLVKASGLWGSIGPLLRSMAGRHAPIH